MFPAEKHVFVGRSEVRSNTHVLVVDSGLLLHFAEKCLEGSFASFDFPFWEIPVSAAVVEE